MGKKTNGSIGWSNDVSRYSVATLMAVTSEHPSFPEGVVVDADFDDDPTVVMSPIEQALLAWRCQEDNTH